MLHRLTIPLLPALLACSPNGFPMDEDIGDESSDSGVDSSESDTGTSDDCVQETSSTSETGDDTTDESETDTTETGDEDQWFVTTAGGIVVGQLMSPSVTEFALPGNMFDGSIPRIAYVMTEDGFAFYVNQHVRVFDSIAHNDIYFTGNDCTGTALDHFATRIPDGIHLNMLTCLSEQDLDGAVQAFEFHYPRYQQAVERLEHHWPGAAGFMMYRISASLNKKWYELPIDQPWPIWAQANSVLDIYTNECTPISSLSMCAVAFNVSDYNISLQNGPFHLEKMP
jgi:hypothetical protein